MNSRNMLIRDEHMGDGSIDQAAIYTREVIRRAIDLGSWSTTIPAALPNPAARI